VVIYISGILISVVLTLALLYFMFLEISPESIIDLGFINFLIDNPGPAFGGLIGMIAVSFLVVLPILMSIPSSIHTMLNQRKIKGKPIKVTGRVLQLTQGLTHTNIEVIYADHKRVFEVDNRVVSTPVNRGSDMTVVYDSKNKQNAYLDFFDQMIQESSSIAQSDTLFKLLEITPRFEVSKNSFELLGELHGGEFQGKKASLVYELARDEISRYQPGTLYPCVISGSTDNYTISILTQT
jgi:hypothetical protein